jgi:hypothetical protein
MDEFKSELDELKKAFLTRHQQIEKEFNEKLNKIIEDQQQQPNATMPSLPIPDSLKVVNQFSRRAYYPGKPIRFSAGL